MPALFSVGRHFVFPSCLLSDILRQIAWNKDKAFTSKMCGGDGPVVNYLPTDMYLKGHLSGQHFVKDQQTTACRPDLVPPVVVHKLLLEHRYTHSGMSYQGCATLWPTGCMPLSMAGNGAQHKIVNFGLPAKMKV